MQSPPSRLADGSVPAPIWRRVLAGTINALVVAGAFTLVGVGAIGVTTIASASPLEPVRRLISARLKVRKRRCDSARLSQFLEGSRTLLTVPGLALELDARNRSSLGHRAAGIRRVDVRTGGPVTRRSVLIRHCVSDAQACAVRQLLRPVTRRSVAKTNEIQPLLRELKAVHADDPLAWRNATNALYREHGVMPLRACLTQVLAFSLVRVPPVFLSPLRQSLADRLSGTVVIVISRSSSGLRSRRGSWPERNR